MIQNCVDMAVPQFQQFLMHIPWHASKWILPPSCLHFLLPVAKRLAKASTHSLTTVAHVIPMLVQRGLIMDKRATREVLLQVLQLSLVKIIPPMLHTHSFMYPHTIYSYQLAFIKQHT